MDSTNETVGEEFFTFDPAVLKIGVRGIYLTLHGLSNRETPGDLELFLGGMLESLSERYAEKDPLLDPILVGFRTLHERIGRSNKRFPSASESLVRLLLRTGKLPRINPLVDIYNAVSLETRLALGAHDIQCLERGVELRISNGTERFVPLGATEPEVIQAGEYGYFDRSGEMICRLEHKQVEKTKVTAETTDCFYVIQGNEQTDDDYLNAAADLLTELTIQYCGGTAGPRWLVS